MMEGENPIFNIIKARFTRPSWAFLLLVVTVVTIFGIQITKNSLFPIESVTGRAGFSAPGGPRTCSGLFMEVQPRKMVKSIIQFGGVGDGKTSNTAAFRKAMGYMDSFRQKGGAQLNVPKGRWLTGSFNLTSNFTLFLEDDAVILGSQVTNIMSY